MRGRRVRRPVHGRALRRGEGCFRRYVLYLVSLPVNDLERYVPEFCRAEKMNAKIQAPAP